MGVILGVCQKAGDLGRDGYLGIYGGKIEEREKTNTGRGK